MTDSRRSPCPINKAVETLGDHWSLVILRDIALHDRRGFREILTGNPEGVSAPMLSRRLASLVEAGLLSKQQVSRGAAGRYSLTENGIQIIPLLFELARVGRMLDPTTESPLIAGSDGDGRAIAAHMDDLRRAHLA